MSDCIFCKVAAHQIPVTPLAENDQMLAFADIQPQAPTHLLVIPKMHYEDVRSVPADLLGHVLKQAGDLGERLLPGGFRVVINTGADAGQTVQHVHLHLLGGRSLTWPPG